MTNETPISGETTTPEVEGSYADAMVKAGQESAITVDKTNNTMSVGNEKTGIVSGIPMDTKKVEGEAQAKPAWLLPKFESTESQAKAYPEAEKYIGELKQRLGAFTGAPAEYDFSSIKEVEFNREDPLFKEVTTYFKTKNISQEIANDLMNLYAKELMGQQQQSAEDLKSLGPDLNEKVTQITQWANNVLTPETAQFVNNLMANPTKESLKLFSELKLVPVGIIPPMQADMVKQMPKDRLDEALKYYTDNMYRGENFSANPSKAMEYEKKIAELIGQNNK